MHKCRVQRFAAALTCNGTVNVGGQKEHLLLVLNVLRPKLLLLSLGLKETVLTLLLLSLVRCLEVRVIKLTDIYLADVDQGTGGNDICLQQHFDTSALVFGSESADLLLMCA